MQHPLSRFRNVLAASACLLAAASVCQATQVIANWDLVPYQRIDEPFKVGVAAFHETGAYVVFKVNNSVVATVYEPTWNDRTQVYEYWFELDPADYSDGALTIDATAYPDGTGHSSRVLASRTLYANDGGTLGSTSIKWADSTNGDDTTGDGSETYPYKTIKKAVEEAGDGGTVYLEAGTYKIHEMAAPTLSYWTTVRAAPGLTADDVLIACQLEDESTTNRYKRSMIRWHRVSLFTDYYPRFHTIIFGESGQKVWYDGVVMFDAKGKENSCQPLNGSGLAAWFTDSYIHDMENAGAGFQRNCYIRNILADIYKASSNLTSINVTVDGIDGEDSGAHPDFVQWYTPGYTTENIIIYNARVYDAECHWLNCGFETSDIAVVNCLFEKTGPDVYISQFGTGCDLDNVLLWHVTIRHQTIWFRDNYVVSNWDVQDCVFDAFSAGYDASLPASCVVDYNHIVWLEWNQPGPLSDHASLGDARFMNTGASDYRLKPTSPAYRRGTPLPDSSADIDGVEFDPDTPNLGCFSSRSVGRLHYLVEADLTYDAVQDGQNSTFTWAEAILPGRAIHLAGNAWKYVPFSYEVRADTVIEFTVDAADTGEITGIVLDDNTDATTGRRAFLFGGSDIGHPSFDAWSWRRSPTYVANSGAVTYRIPVGKYFTGTVNYLGFIADDDIDASSDVIFSDIRIGEALPFLILDADEVAGYDYQDGDLGLGSSAEVSFDGLEIALGGNVWKTHPISTTVASDTVLSFTVDGSDVGEILGVALDADDTALDTKRAFIFGGSDVNFDYSSWSWKLDDLYTAGTGPKTYFIPVGQHFTGAANYLVLFDDDDNDASSDVTFSKIRIGVNSIETFDSQQIDAYGSVQDGQDGSYTNATVSGDGKSVTLTGNAWKTHPLTTTVTPATLLVVTVNASDVGEIIGIALDSDNDPTLGRRAFIFGGSSYGAPSFDDWAWHIPDPSTDAAYSAGSGSVTYIIPVGEYFAGSSVIYIGFIADDDADASTNVTFSDIRVF